MRRRLSRSVATMAIVTALATVSMPQAANAASAFTVNCPMQLNWSFSAGLSVNPTVGTAFQTYFGGCVDAGASVWTSPLLPPPFSQGVTAYLQNAPFSTSGLYSGSCLLASVEMGFWPGHTALLVGGTVLVGTLSFGPTIQFGELYELTPLLAPCLQTTAIGAGVAWGAGGSF